MNRTVLFQMIFLPEGFDYIAKTNTQAAWSSDTLDGLIIQHYRALARKYKIWLSLGGYHERLVSESTQTQNMYVYFAFHSVLKHLIYLILFLH